MRKALKPIVVMAMAGAVAVVVPWSASAAASSSAIVNTSDTRAGEAFFNRPNGTHGSNAWIDVYDAKCDAHSVYVYFEVPGWPPDGRRFTNDGGCGTTSGVNIAPGQTIQYKVCVDVQLGNDPCSGWKTDHS